MNNRVALKFKNGIPFANPIFLELPASKSISNRLLMLQFLYFPDLIIQNLSEANDTKLMQLALDQLSEAKTIQVEDAGTVARFITAAALFSPQEVYISGTERMQQRPMGELMQILETLGASILYIDKNEYLPFKIKGINSKISDSTSLEISISTSKSSQFLSALLMIAPKLNKQITIDLKGERNSWSYVEMTIQLMISFGFIVKLLENKIVIQPFIPQLRIPTYKVENDWSAASFMLEILSNLPVKTALRFNNLHASEKSLQGDAVLSQWANDLNLKHMGFDDHSTFEVVDKLELIPDRSFKSNPDLTLPYLMSLVLRKKKFSIRHVDSLQYKESDRIAAITIELKKCDVYFKKIETGYTIDATNLDLKPHTIFNSHNDHRIAMSLAPLAMYAPILILNPEVVNKSFPKYWDELRKLNFEVRNN